LVNIALLHHCVVRYNLHKIDRMSKNDKVSRSSPTRERKRKKSSILISLEREQDSNRSSEKKNKNKTMPKTRSKCLF
jgi:hypothetical protein